METLPEILAKTTEARVWLLVREEEPAPGPVAVFCRLTDAILFAERHGMVEGLTYHDDARGCVWTDGSIRAYSVTGLPFEPG